MECSECSLNTFQVLLRWRQTRTGWKNERNGDWHLLISCQSQKTHQIAACLFLTTALNWAPVRAKNDLSSYFAKAHYVYFFTKFPKNNAPYKLDTFLCLQMGIEPRPSRMMTEGIWLASNSANGEFSLLPLILCMKLKAHHEWRWLMPLDWPLTYLIKSCGLSTEFLASNSANDEHSVSGMKSKAEDIKHHCWVGGHSSFITFQSYKTK